jgi:hypothetical protein
MLKALDIPGDKTDEELLKMLSLVDGNVEHAYQLLVHEPPAAEPMAEPAPEIEPEGNQADVDELVSWGFDLAAVHTALEAAGGNRELAANMLLG